MSVIDVNYEELSDFSNPKPLGPRHKPIPHDIFYYNVRELISDKGYYAEPKLLKVKDDGSQLFGTFNIGEEHDGLQAQVGFRNSHDQSFAAGLAVGSEVLVCENLMFTYSKDGMAIAKRHTTNVLDSIWNDFEIAINHLNKNFDEHLENKHHLSNIEMNMDEQFKMLGLLYGHNAILPTQAGSMIKELREPSFSHDEASKYGYDSAWACYNAGTQALKKSALGNTISAHQNFHNHFMDEVKVFA